MTNSLLVLCVVIQLCGSGEGGVCNLRELTPLSAYAKAYFEQQRPVTGCVSHEKTEDQKTIHVIGLANWNDTRNQIPVIELNLQNVTHDENSPGRIFVLASEQPVRWLLQADTKRHVVLGRFLVSDKSEISHRSHLRIRIKKLSIPFAGDKKLLERWAREKWGAVTNFLFLEQSVTYIKLPIDTALNGDQKCHFKSDLANIRAGRTDEQPVKGCLSRPNQTDQHREIHILELYSASMNTHIHPTSTTVHLHLELSYGLPTSTKHRLLILKSHHPVKWKVTSPRLKGSVDIVTDRPVDSAGLNAKNFRMAAERLGSYSGRELIAWVTEKYGHLTSYTFVKFANRVDLMTDAKGGNHFETPLADSLVEKHPNTHDPRAVDAAETRKLLKHSIIRALSLNCKEHRMTISILKYPFRNFHVSGSNISLLDFSCQAVDAGAQFSLTTRYSDCGTHQVITRDGAFIYTNAIVVQPQLTSSASQDFRMKSLDNNVKYPIIINVSCHYLAPKNEITSVLSDLQFDMKLFNDKTYSHEILFPAKLSPTDSIFVEISMKRNNFVGVDVRNCSLEPQRGMHLKEHWLLTNGCDADKTFDWINDDEEEDASFSSNKRFLFKLPDTWKPETVSRLKCSITICNQDPEQSTEGIALCLSSARNCNFPRPTHTQVVTVLTQGPLILSSAEKSHQPKVTDAPSRVGFAHIATESDNSRQKEMTQHSTCSDIVVYGGVPAGVVIGISFAAFLIGVMLMASLWCIHAQTGPKKKIGLKSSDSKLISNSTLPISCDSTLPTIHCSSRLR